MSLRLPLPRPGQIRRVAKLVGSSDALAIARLARDAGPILVVTGRADEAGRLEDEIPLFAPGLRVHLFPDWETLPYDRFSPHQDLVSERLATLYQITQRAFDVVVVPVATALYRLPPAPFLAAHAFLLRQGGRLDLEALRRQLALAAYTPVGQVQAPGEFSLRGGIIDLFPAGSAVPYRIELFDDEIASMRAFDVDTQRSIYPVQEVRLLRAREFPLNEAGIARFRSRWRERFEGDASKNRIYRDVSQGLAPPGIESYLPLFFEETARLTDYLPEDVAVVLHGAVEAAARGFWEDARSRYRMLSGDPERPLLEPEELFLSAEDFFAAIKPRPRLELLEGEETPPLAHTEAAPVARLPCLETDRRANAPFGRLAAFLKDFPGRVLLAAESLGRREVLADVLAAHGLKPEVLPDLPAFETGDSPFALTVAPLSQGFVLPEEGLAFVTENELFAEQVRQARLREAKRTVSEHALRDLTEVRENDPVVHEEHGIGRYRGLVTMDLGEGPTELLVLEYAGGDKLYVPVAHLHLVSRYSGGPPEAAPLHRLGSGQWEKARRRAAQKVHDTAAELLALYARRAARQGHVFRLKHEDYEAFAAGFPFEETPDQAAAIAAVLADMTSGKAMDRLVCGDVGFGKTEVALRAAFVAVADGRQVAVLVPTTLLAEQHYQTFSDRFAEWPVKVAELSRFRTAKEQAKVLADLAQGRIDIVIGTHRLLQKDVRFKDLGLVIIDEEHRFGVRQKEALKALRAEVDVLTLTATPIPRTLSMALEGLRDFSVIATAPSRRLAIKTFVEPYSEGLVREAVLRELKRGGQVYFVHNEVESIEAMRTRLAATLPEARIGVAHGQMRERELEHVMRDFYHQRFNLLLCTTIIETGIDVPTANTILIHRADKFGLAQLHQLRGRVGRSHHQAYAYLLVQREVMLKPTARKRLEAIQAMEDLGVGFHLAMHDLEIRGAGEILGESQSGEMQEIGFSLYTRMLARAVEALKSGEEPDLVAPLAVATEINLHAPTLLPEDYVDDVHERLVLYKRLASTDRLEALEALAEELVDRFGPLPEAARALLALHRLRILAKPLGVARVDATPNEITLHFGPHPRIDPSRIVALVQTRRHWRLAGPEKLKCSKSAPDTLSRARAVETAFEELSTP